MSGYVVDANVAVKWIVEEDDGAKARALLAFPLAAPDLLLAECANVLWKKVQRGDVTADQAYVGMAAVRDAPIALYRTEPLAEAALRMAVELRHPAYDCFYLLLARELGFPLVTADRRLVQTATRLPRGKAVGVLRLAAWTP